MVKKTTTTFSRNIVNKIKDDLKHKMVFIGGPRQVGKTTLSKMLTTKKYLYLSWDNLEDRKLILNFSFSKDVPVIIFDEIHKYKLWRTLLKGLFDKYRDEMQIIVTGSARLDYFRKGGDSLLGRYHYHRLHPFTLPELKTCTKINNPIEALLTFGGFPEPLFSQDHKVHRRWLLERQAKIIKEDLTDISTVKDISIIELLAEILPTKVGSLFSNKSIQEDLSVSSITIDRWVTILENLYFCYRIYPYGINRIKAVKKMPKLYMWDWSAVTNTGPRFENFVAGHLLKFCHQTEDQLGHKMHLHFLKDNDGQKELDFVIVKDKKPLFAVECKTGESSLSPHLAYFQKHLKIPKVYQVHLGTKDYGSETSGGRVLSFKHFCQLENLV